VNKALQCKMFNALPRAGGLEDQPAGLIRKMMVAYNYWTAHRAYAEHDYSHHAEWMEANKRLFALVKEVREICEKDGIDAII